MAALQDYLGNTNDAVILENGAVLFDLATSRYSVSGEYNKCLLQVWSNERNIVRRVLDAQLKHDTLRVTIQKLGQAKPSKLEICRNRDRRTPTAKRLARMAYQRKLERVLQRRFPDFKMTPLHTAMDLERSFGPIYSRGMVRKGQTAFAVLGVNEQETQSSIDAALTFGILWLDVCRQSHAGKLVVEGLKLFVPRECSALIRERMAHLNAPAAKWHLYEFDQREDAVTEIDPTDRGNIATRLVHCTDEMAVHERFAAEIARVKSVMSEAEIAILSPAEIAFRCHGLEFARARFSQNPSASKATEIVFGLGAEEAILSETTAFRFELLVRSIGEVRHLEGPPDHPLFRMHPERWLESLVVKQIGDLDERLDISCVYSQVPAFSASDRAMIDVLAATRLGRLAVIELKADEDIHLPLQGLDYWSRVAWHHERGEFQRFGYFPGRELIDERPLLLLVAPALRVHPATDTILRYISPQVDWTLTAIDERWRNEIRVIFRKRAKPISAGAVA